MGKKGAKGTFTLNRFEPAVGSSETQLNFIIFTPGQ